MKNKTKLVLGLAALTAVTAGAATTSTLAWFTTTRTGTVSFSSIGVYGATGDLGITLSKSGSYGFNGTVPDLDTTDNSYKFTSTISNALTDISGNGAQFYRPVWKPGADGTTASKIDTAINNTPAGSYYSVQFILKLTNSSTVNALNVYFQNTIEISSTGTNTGDGNNAKAGHSARVAMFNYGTTAKTEIALADTPTKTFYDGTDSDTTSSYYITKTTTEANEAFGVSYHLNSTVLPLTSLTDTDFGTELTADPGTSKKSFVTTIAASGTQYIGFSIWLEGNSASCKITDTEDPRKENLKVVLPLVAF